MDGVKFKDFSKLDVLCAIIQEVICIHLEDVYFNIVAAVLMSPLRTIELLQEVKVYIHGHAHWDQVKALLLDLRE